MDLTERTIESKTMFQGRIITVLLDTAGLPDGGTAQREVVLHPGGVAILALDEADKLDPGEDHRPAALRELSEETGLEAGELTYLGHIYASPGFCDEALHMYLARDLTRARQHLDEDEFLDVVTMPFDTLVEQVMSGEITDAKTVATVLKVKTLLGR